MFSVDSPQACAKVSVAEHNAMALDFVGGGRFVVFGDNKNLGGVINANLGSLVQRLPHQA